MAHRDGGVRLRTVALVPASPAAVWEELRHIARHREWMSDAVAIRFLTDATEGVGVCFECDTKVGPLRLTDRMEVTEWRHNEAMAIRHTGVVSGHGRFRLLANDGDGGTANTRIEWTETLRFPWWMGGPLGAVVAHPLLRAVWKRNLRRFASRF